MKLTKYLFISTAIFFGLFLVSYAALSDPFISIQLAPSPSNGDCLTTDGTDNAWGSCGSGSGTNDWQVLTSSGTKYLTSSTTNYALLSRNGLISHGSSTFSDYINVGAGTSTFTGGIFTNDLRTNLPSCDSVDTDASGAIICGVDNTGTDSADDLSDNSISDLSDVSAMTEATGDLFYYNGGWDRLAVGTRGNILSVTAGGVPSWIATSTMPLGGDVTGTLSASVVGNDSHDHTGATLSGLDISDDTNLTGGLGLTLTGDDMACDTASGSVFGCLASADWTTFNNKADLGSAMTGTFDGNNFAGGAIGAGDLLYGASAGSITELSIGTRGNILSVTTGGLPGWIATSTMITGFANDLKDCTDCINATEIEDIYLLNSGDSSTGNYFFAGSLNASSTAHIDGDVRLANSLFSRKVYGGTTTAGSLNIFPNDQTFAYGNTGRIRFGERSVVNLSNTTGNADTIVDNVISLTGTTHASSTVNSLRGVNDSRVFRYSGVQTLSSLPTFGAATIYQPVAAVKNNAAYLSGFVSEVVFNPSIASGQAKADYLFGYNSRPEVSETGGGTAAVTNMAAFQTYVDFDLFLNHWKNNSSIENFTHYSIGNPSADGTVTLGNITGLSIPDLSTFATGTASGITSAMNTDSDGGRWFLNHSGTATSTHTGAFSIGTTTANYVGGLTVDGLLVTGGNTPSIGGCATGATLRGNNNAGIITIGTDTTSCNIKFSKVLVKTPSCIVNDQTDGGTTRVSAASTTGFQITGTTINTNVINWHCLGVE